VTDAPREPCAPWLRPWAWLLDPARRPLLCVILIAIVIGFGVLMVRRATHGSSDFPMGPEYSRRLLLEGENVYETEPAAGTHTKYPPFFFLLLTPLAAAPLWLAALLWYAVNVVLLAASAWWAVAALKPGGTGPPTLAEVLAPLALGLPLVLLNLPIGQANVLVLACVAGGLWLLARRRDLSGGGALAAAVALKLTPALIVAGLGWKRAWRALLGALLALALCWAVLPALVFGPGRAAEVTRSWSRVVLGFVHQGAAAEGRPAIPPGFGYRQTNQSLDAAVHRFLTDVPAVRAKDRREDFFVNVAHLEPEGWVIGAVVKAFAGLLLLALLWLARGTLASTPRLVLGLEVALASIAILVVAPVSWDSHYIALLVPYAVALEAIRRRRPGDRVRAWLVRALAGCVALSLMGTCPYLRAFSVLLFGALVLGVALAMARVAERKAVASSTR